MISKSRSRKRVGCSCTTRNRVLIEVYIYILDKRNVGHVLESQKNKNKQTSSQIPCIVAWVEGLAALFAFEAPLVQYNTFDRHLLYMIHALVTVGTCNFDTTTPKRLRLKRQKRKDKKKNRMKTETRKETILIKSNRKLIINCYPSRLLV